MRMASPLDKRWAKKAAEWNSGFSIKHADQWEALKRDGKTEIVQRQALESRSALHSLVFSLLQDGNPR